MKGMFSFGGKKPGAVKKPSTMVFDDDDDKPSYQRETKLDVAPADPGEVDPLDAFMAVNKKAQAVKVQKVQRLDEEDEDPEAEYLIALQKKKAEAKAKAKPSGLLTKPEDPTLVKDDPEEEMDSDDEVYAAAKAAEAEAGDEVIIPNLKTFMEELNRGVDHSKIEYNEFEKCFYDEHPEIFALSEQEVSQLRRQLDVRVQGEDPPRPISKFEHCGFPPEVAKDIAKHGYTTPTPIQAQSLPAALMGRDILGIAKTGSGKTAAFTLPMLVHILDQDYLEEGDGPIGLVLAPTRELSQQIFVECRKFAKTSGIAVAGAYGGASKNEQRLDLRKGAEIVVATPGRMIDMLKCKATNCRRTTYLVLDEADRMLDMGFEPQIRCCMGQIRPSRQTLMYSATFKKRIRELADTLLSDPVHITVGSIGEASSDVNQVIRILPDASHKWSWLMEMLPGMVDDGEVIIFVAQKASSEELATNLKNFNFKAEALHGDKDQRSRDKIFTDFKKGICQVLVATDVAARGLDVPTIRNVVCFDPPRDKDAHTHRIGRTGRAGEKGAAYSLITKDEIHEAALLVRSLQEVGQPIPEDLLALAEREATFTQRNPAAGRGRGRGGFGGGASGGGFGGPPRTGRGRGNKPIRGGFGLGYDKHANPAPSGGDTTAGFGLATATGGGFVAAKNRLAEQYQSSFIKTEVVERRIEGGIVTAEQAGLAPITEEKKSNWKLNIKKAPQALPGFPPPPPGGFPAPPPGAPGVQPQQPEGMSLAAQVAAARINAKLSTATVNTDIAAAAAAAAAKINANLAVGGPPAAAPASSSIDAFLNAAATKATEGQGNTTGQGERKRKSRWDTQ